MRQQRVNKKGGKIRLRYRFSVWIIILHTNVEELAVVISIGIKSCAGTLERGSYIADVELNSVWQFISGSFMLQKEIPEEKKNDPVNKRSVNEGVRVLRCPQILR